MMRSRLVANAAIIALLICVGLRSEYTQDLSSNLLLVSERATSLSDVNEEIRALHEQVDNLKKRFWLESLEPIWQYRAKYWLGKTGNVEDKDQVIPFLLGNFVNASDTTVYKRRIYIDLGIKDFDSSLCWIMQNYPVKFDALYGFECATNLSDVRALEAPITKCVEGTSAAQRGYTPAGVTDSMQLYYNYVGLDDSAATSPPTRGLSQFLRDINVQEDDFVVLKMDVEGAEYDLLERLMADGSHKLIDEVFVEIHYNHPEMHVHGWYIFEHSRSEAQALFNKARDLGMYIHPWP